MARIVQFQTNFSVGELDPLLRARTDLQQYQNALETAENVTIQPQGGASRRAGLEFIHNLGSSYTSFKLIPFEFSVNDSYLLVVVTGAILVFKGGVLQTNINGTGNTYIAVPAITAGMINELNFTQAVDTLILVHEDLQPQRIVRNSDTSWTVGALPLTNVPKYAYTITTTSGTNQLTVSGADGNIDVTASSGTFASTDVDQYINVTPFGRLRIVDFVSTSKVRAYCEVPLFNSDNIPAADYEFERGYEDVVVHRGFPRSAAFHESRLYFGGSKSRPNTIWGSKVIDFFNFDVGTALDDESVEATINTNQLIVIVNLNPGQDLQIFSTGGEFIVAQAANEPVTPANFLIKPQSRLGSRPGVPVEDLGGATIIVQRQGKSLISFQFTDSTASYGSQPLSVLSSHLLNDPTDLSIRRATSTDETDRLFLVNGGDGSMAVYSILQAQNVIAPSRFTTDGEFVAVANELSDTFVIV